MPYLYWLGVVGLPPAVPLYSDLVPPYTLSASSGRLYGFTEVLYSDVVPFSLYVCTKVVLEVVCFTAVSCTLVCFTVVCCTVVSCTGQWLFVQWYVLQWSTVQWSVVQWYVIE